MPTSGWHKSSQSLLSPDTEDATGSRNAYASIAVNPLMSLASKYIHMFLPCVVGIVVVIDSIMQ